MGPRSGFQFTHFTFRALSHPSAGSQGRDGGAGRRRAAPRPRGGTPRRRSASGPGDGARAGPAAGGGRWLADARPAQLLQGSAEHFGVELEKGKPYSFYTDAPLSFFSWYGGSLRTEGMVQLALRPAPHTVATANLHAEMEKLREHAERKGEEGPRVRRGGRRGRAARSLTTSRCRYWWLGTWTRGRRRCAACCWPLPSASGGGRRSWTWTWARMPSRRRARWPPPSSTATHSTCSPGSSTRRLSCTRPATAPPAPTCPPTARPPTSLRAAWTSEWPATRRVRPAALHRTQRGPFPSRLTLPPRCSRPVRVSGLVVNTCGWTQGDGYAALVRVAHAFRAGFVFVMGDNAGLERALRRDLRGLRTVVKRPPVAAPVRCPSPRAPLCPAPPHLAAPQFTRSRDVRRELRSEAVRAFFYGPRHALVQLQPVEQSVQFASLRVYEWRQNRGDRDRPVLGEVSLLRETLQGKLLAIVHAEEAQRVAAANVAGFVAVCVVPSPSLPVAPPPSSPPTRRLPQAGRGSVGTHCAAAVPEGGPAAQQVRHRGKCSVVAVAGTVWLRGLPPRYATRGAR